jgi:hypothetical protein
MACHATLQKANRHAAAEKTVRKMEAGAITFVVAQTIGLATGRSHTYSVKIIQCEIGTHIVARLALHREEERFSNERDGSLRRTSGAPGLSR